MIRLAAPLSGLLLIPVAIAAWRMYRHQVRRGLLFAPVHRIPADSASWRIRASQVLPAFFVTGLVLGVIALARPQTVLSSARDTREAISIQMVVDVSGSMEALDLSVKTATGIRERTRLDAVKETFATFVEKRPSDLLGLVTFGGYASTRTPLTGDHDALLHVLKGVEIPRQSVDANGRILNQEELLTAIGDALATACARLENAPTKTRIIVLLSDGESNTGIIKPDQALELAKKMGIRIYAIGVGTNGEAPFRTRDIFGRQTIQRAQVTLDEELLKRLSRETGGQYFNVRDPSGFDQAMETINDLETTKVQQDVYYQYRELFPWFLVPAILLVLLGSALNMHWVRRVA